MADNQKLLPSLFTHSMPTFPPDWCRLPSSTSSVSSSFSISKSRVRRSWLPSRVRSYLANLICSTKSGRKGLLSFSCWKRKQWIQLTTILGYLLTYTTFLRLASGSSFSQMCVLWQQCEKMSSLVTVGSSRSTPLLYPSLQILTSSRGSRNVLRPILVARADISVQSSSLVRTYPLSHSSALRDSKVGLRSGSALRKLLISLLKASEQNPGGLFFSCSSQNLAYLRSVMRRQMRSWERVLTKGGVPVYMMKRMTPMAKMSTFSPSQSPASISGALQPCVPTLEVSLWSPWSPLESRASPKSEILRVKLRSKRMFSGLRSRWVMPTSERQAMAEIICLAQVLVISGVNLPVLEMQSKSSPPSASSSTMRGRFSSCLLLSLNLAWSLWSTWLIRFGCFNLPRNSLSTRQAASLLAPLAQILRAKVCPSLLPRQTLACPPSPKGLWISYQSAY